MGPFMPGIAPGVGRPLQGTVRDGRTYLPVGGATVTSGLGSTVTDANGHYNLYGSLASDEISVSRAGYVAKTVGGVTLDPATPMDLTLDSAFDNDGMLPTGSLDVRGTVLTPAKQIATPDGLISLGGIMAPISNGQFQVQFSSQLPGKLYTAVLAGGRISGTYDPKVNVTQPFNFETFGYSLVSLAAGDTMPQGLRNTSLTIDGSVQISPSQVKYSNLGNLNAVQTSIYLDFGVAGKVLVAEATGSNQAVKVPRIPGIKYVVAGQAFNDAKNQSSAVIITTDDPGQAPFQMLTPPKLLGPSGQHVGARPTFSWTASPVPNVVYELQLFETDGKTAGSKKWTATTTVPEITYPGFSLADVNGGALRPDRQYYWKLRVIDTLTTLETPTSRKSVLDVKPLRSRQREASSDGGTFTI